MRNRCNNTAVVAPGATRRVYVYAGLISTTLLMPAAAQAHGIGALYNLPVPLWLYGWSAAATLVLSFMMAGLVLGGPREPAQARFLDISAGRFAWALRQLVPALRLLGVLVLLLCIAAGFVGSRDPARNFGLTFFWVTFALLFPYLTLLSGNFFAALNPWRTLADGLERVWKGWTRGRMAYPAGLGHWPALAMYLGFVWFELFGNGHPVSLAVFLTGYSLLNLLGVWLVGASAWFQYCEFFSVLFRLIALLGPIDYQRGDALTPRRLRLRWPCSGLITERPKHLSTLVFALAMLATTAFDGLKATQWWVSVFWSDPTGLLTLWQGASPFQASATLLPWYKLWESLWLLMAPFVYLGAYLLALSLARWFTGTPRPIRELALDFGYSLLPIALAYHITHYTTLVLAHGLKIVSLISDPFGRKWDLFGTAHWLRAPILPDVSWIWHGQVMLILLGHILSVFIAHRVALQLFPTRRDAMLSQVPMLILMIGLTVSGLWILAQPLTELRWL